MSPHVAKEGRKADITKAKETVDPIIISQYGSLLAGASCQMTSYSLIKPGVLQSVSSIDRHVKALTGPLYIRN